VVGEARSLCLPGNGGKQARDLELEPGEEDSSSSKEGCGTGEPPPYMDDSNSR